MRILSPVQKTVLIFFSFIILLSFPCCASAAETLVWNEVEVQETTKKEKVKEVKTEEKAKEDTATDKLINEFRRKQEEDNKLFERLIEKQNKEQELQKEKARKEELSKLLTIQAKQTQETEQKLTAALNEVQELKKQNQYFIEFIEEFKKQQSEQQTLQAEQQAKQIQELMQEKTEQEILIQELTAKKPETNIVSQVNTTNSYTPTNMVFTNKATENKAKTVQEYIKESTQDGSEAYASEADIIFSYSPGALYRVYCSEGFLTDIQLQSGEEIQYVGGGDTARWMIATAQSGTGSEGKWHIYLKPIRSGLHTNFVVTTNRRSYQIQAEAGDWYNPIVRWTYPDDFKKVVFAQEQLENNSISFSATSTENMNFNYKISKKNYVWSPQTVFDDGVKTYIKMPAQMFTGEAPVLFIKDSNGVLAMVNYRLKNGCYIVDRLFNEAELRNGKEIVTIKRAKG